jgi:integrase
MKTKNQQRVRIYSPEDLNSRWYLYYTVDGKMIKLYSDLGKHKTYRKRLEAASELASELDAKIGKGYYGLIPFDVPYRVYVGDALNKGLVAKKDSISHKTFLDYSCALRFFLKGLDDLCLGELMAEELNRKHVKAVMDYMANKHNWKPLNYNKHMRYLKTVFAEVVELGIIAENPIRDIKTKTVIKTYDAHIPFDDETHKIVFNNMREEYFNFYVFCSFIYYCGIRPKELSLLKCSDIDIKNQQINISSESSKTNRKRIVPILGTILDDLMKFDLSNPNNYLFGYKGCPKNNKNAYTNFCPSPLPMSKNSASEAWRQHVKRVSIYLKNLDFTPGF